jgi:AcrR family transcriptional regulator
MATDDVRRRPGGRSAEKRAAVLAASLELLARSGPDAVTVAAVAARAGVHETSIYRRWGTRERLLLEAMAGLSSNLLPVPNTGSLRDDLIVFGQSLVAYVESELGKALTRILAINDDDDATSQVRSEFWDARWAECRAMVERAVARGELPASVDGRFLIEVFVAPIHARALLTRDPVTTELLGVLADVAIAGVPARVSH